MAFTDFSTHWMRSLKIKGCNYILLAAVNLRLKQIILLVWVFLVLFFCGFFVWFVGLFFLIA